ncbi:MAG: hypothetical protein QME66_11995 [Candidatus Eisenbacteria bacterium]|nr:hypothetical protein [Candidatus Eisenbacteria bacterium]
MKIRTWFLFLGIVILSFYLGSCRKQRPLFERNEPPDTFIVTATEDSSQIYYRANLHWAGVDPDGQVVGFYVAFTDTGNPPQYYDWRWTASTETTVTLQANLPQVMGHTLYVKSVDNSGTEDPTPARYDFFSRDATFPRVRNISAYAVVRGQTYPIRSPYSRTAAPRDTIPFGTSADSIHFSWNGFDDDPGGYVTGYRYKADVEMLMHEVGASDTVAVYPLNMFGPGQHSFQVSSIDDAGAKTFEDSTRAFVVGFDPETWVISASERTFGPMKDPSLVKSQADGDTLNDTYYLAFIPNLTFSFIGADNPENNAAGIVAYSAKVHRSDEFGEAWPPANPNATTYGKSGSGGFFYSGDYTFQVRSSVTWTDLAYTRNDGTPAKYYFSINHAPGVVDYGLTPSPDTTFTVVIGDSLNELLVRFFCLDVDGIVTEYRITLLNESGTREIMGTPWTELAIKVQRPGSISERFTRVPPGTYLVRISLRDDAKNWLWGGRSEKREGSRKYKIRIVER